MRYPFSFRYNGICLQWEAGQSKASQPFGDMFNALTIMQAVQGASAVVPGLSPCPGEGHCPTGGSETRKPFETCCPLQPAARLPSRVPEGAGCSLAQPTG